MSESHYSEFFAEFYDILHSHLDDVEAYKKLVSRSGGDILELGSGTGRILIPLAREGNRVTGLEASEKMLKVCRKKMKDETDDTTGNIDLIQGDIREFDLDKGFDMILAPCNLVNYLDTSDLKRTLSRVRSHLSDEGVLVIDNSIPDVERMVENDGEEQVFEYEHPENGRKIIDSFTATYDFVDQIERDKIIISEYDGEKKTRETAIEETLTFYFPRELKVILRCQGFEILEERGSLHENVPITEDSEEMILFCRPRD